MSDKIIIELDSKYSKHLELLKQMILSDNWEEIIDDSKMIEVLIDNFISFLKDQVSHHSHEHGESCCWKGGH